MEMRNITLLFKSSEIFYTFYLSYIVAHTFVIAGSNGPSLIGLLGRGLSIFSSYSLCGKCFLHVSFC